MEIQNISLDSGSGLKINCCLRSPDSKNDTPLVIFVHGFKGFMNWGGFPYFTSALCESGLSVVSLDFTMNGVSPETPLEFTRLDLFAENTISAELDELKIVIDHFYNNSAKYNINKERMALTGHSRGGAVSILKSAEDNRIKALITLAAVSSFERYTKDQVMKWKEKGYLEIPNTRTRQMMRMNVSFLEDIESNPERFDVKSAMGSLNIPALLIHGREDLAVKYNEAMELYQCSDKEKTELVILENTGHTFGIEHPFKGSTRSFDEVLKISAEFLNKNL